ncbi:MAG: RiPP maturation radical SAM C-methyltransferase [Saprospiraceae bacterium]|nr:RiPP maturation radical SAM C-methyltransferase [Saprospiraceae bacterium]
MKIHLINMPFGYLRLPSIALTQLKAVIQNQFNDQVVTTIHYLNLDFGAFIGTGLYDFIAENPAAMHCNIGEWFFRAVAFPEAPDNTNDYLSHFDLHTEWADHINEHSDGIKTPISKDQIALKFFVNILLEKREKLNEFLDELIEKYQLDQCDLLGLTSMFTQNLPAFALARKLKARNPNLVIVMGGANCESPMGEEIARQIPSIDFVFSGPALLSFPCFIQYLLDRRLELCHAIDGVFSKTNLLASKVDSVVHRRGAELNINTWIDLDYDDFIHLIKVKWKALHIVPVLLFETSRGCWWGARSHCTFCGLNTNSMGYRAMNPEMAVLYLTRFFKKFGKKVKYYSSVDNIMPREYLESVFPKLELPNDLSIFYEVKADLSKAELAILSKARIRTMQPGIESLNTSTLKLMKKGETAAGNISLLKNSTEAGIRMAWNLLLGFPGDPESSYEVYAGDFDALYHLQPPKSVYTVRFDRYSPYFMKPGEHGLMLVPADFYFYLYPDWPFEKLFNLAYYFEDANSEAEYKKLTARWLPGINKKVARWVARFNGEDQLLRPLLFMEPQTGCVYDTRSGALKIQPISELEQRLLVALDQPTKLISLFQLIRDTAPTEIEDTLNELITKKYVYHENRKKFLSLVHTSAEGIKTQQSRVDLYQENAV